MYIYIYIYTYYDILCICTYILCICIYTGRTKVALVELLTVILFVFFICTPFPLRILAWSCVVPRSTFHPPKAFNLIDLKAGDT